MKEEWKDKLQNSLADYKESAPKGLWDDIEKALAANATKIGKQEKERRKLRIVAIRTVAAAACAAVALGIFWYETSNEKETNVASHGFASNQYASKKKETQTLASVAMPSKETVGASKQLITNAEKITTLVYHDEDKEEKATYRDDDKGTVTANESTQQKDEEKSVMIGEKASRSGIHQQYAHQQTSINNSRQHYGYDGNRLTASIFAANTMANGGTQTARVMAASNGTTLLCMPSTEDGNKIGTYYVGKEEDETVKHHQPIRMGVSVRYALSQRIGIETGLTYSYLSSDIKQGPDENCMLAQQKLHFIGIPLNISYNIWKNRWVNVYLSAGGMAEKNVKGKTNTTYMLNGKQLSEESNKVKMKELQWSANIAAGLQLNATKDVGLYIEPGLGYYFDNGSSIKTAYSEKPLNFNLKLGLRYSFE